MKNYSKKFIDLDNESCKLINLTNYLRMPAFEENLSSEEMNTFEYLAKFGAASMKELSEFIEVKPNIMTGIILRLQKKEMVSRYENFNDRRIVMVEVTPKWQQIHEMYINELERISQIVVKTIGEEKFDLLLKILSETTDKLQKEADTIQKNV